MYCPKCGHELANDNRRFCSRCGLLLDGVSELLTGNEERLESEKRVLLGTRLAFAAQIVSLIYLIALGIFGLFEILNKSTFLTVWAIYLVVAFGLSIVSSIILARGGYFKKLSEREKRVKSPVAAAGNRGELEAVKESLQAATNPSLHLPEMVSVTETTTRNLEEPLKAPDRAVRS
jgi:cytochrome c biogenesis protein CcdA